MAIPIPLTSLRTPGEPMRAAVYRRFGPPDVIRMETVARPEPRSREIRVRVMATTVTSACTMMRRGDTVLARLVLGLFGPRRRFQIAGTEFAGIVEKVGAEATGWRPGDRVFGFAGFNVGTYAEAFCLPAAGSVSLMPADMSFEEAASLVDGPTTALYFFTHLAKLRPGERVLVIGASGSVGGAAVQVARAMGARVTGVCSTSNVELVRSLGAHAVVDYSREELTKTGPYDVIFDAVTKSSFSACKSCLAPGGRYMPTVATLLDYICMGATKLVGERRILCGMSVEKRTALEVVKDLWRQGALRSVVDRRYPLEEIAAAHRYVDTGRKRGNVVIDVGPVVALSHESPVSR